MSLTYQNTEGLADRGLEVTYPAEDVQISLTGRKNLLDSMSNRDIQAYVDLNQIQKSGIQSVNITVKKNVALYTRTDYVNPQEVTIAVRPLDKE